MSEESRQNERKVHAYNRMMERVKAAFGANSNTAIGLAEALANAKEKAVEAEELTREEAEQISEYLKRDLEDAGHFLADSQNELADWLHFDLELIEDRLSELLQGVADRTRVDLALLAEHARHADEYYTGEITGPGTLECTNCGKQMVFHKAGHIPPCPACHKTTFVRVRRNRNA